MIHKVLNPDSFKITTKNNLPSPRLLVLASLKLLYPPSRSLFSYILTSSSFPTQNSCAKQSTKEEIYIYHISISPSKNFKGIFIRINGNPSQTGKKRKGATQNLKANNGGSFIQQPAQYALVPGQPICSVIAFATIWILLPIQKEYYT